MSQILNGRGVSTTFDSDGVHITRTGQRIDIPLPAIQEVRTADARTVEFLLTDGTIQRAEGGNRVATSTFAEAVTAALPERRDPAAAAMVTETGTPPDRALYVITALCALVVLAFIGYAVWVGLTHGARVVMVIVGVLPLVAGVVMPVSGIAETVRRIVLKRRGVTVLARAVGKEGKQTVYRYTDAAGRARSYTCKRALERIQLTYDPAERVGAAHADWLPFVIGRVYVKVFGGVFWLIVGVVMVFGVLW
ncbi:hypothetical protein [Streptomyces sp. NPDC001759]